MESNIDHFWFSTISDPFIIVDHDIGILSAGLYKSGISGLYKCYIKEDIISHTSLPHIATSRTISPITDHAPRHTIYRGELDKYAHICECPESLIAESEEAIEDDEFFWLYYFSWFSLALPSRIIAKIVLRDLY